MRIDDIGMVIGIKKFVSDKTQLETNPATFRREMTTKYIVPSTRSDFASFGLGADVRENNALETPGSRKRVQVTMTTMTSDANVHMNGKITTLRYLASETVKNSRQVVIDGEVKKFMIEKAES